QPAYVGLINVNANGAITCTNNFVQNDAPEELGRQLFQVFRSRIFAFTAQRYNIGAAAHTGNPQLDTSAQTLPSCLEALLTSRRALFQQYVNAVRRVLPHIWDISVPARQAGTVQVKIWYEDPDSGRDDLAVSL